MPVRNLGVSPMWMLHMVCFTCRVLSSKDYLQCSGDGVGGRWEFLKPRWLDAGDKFKCEVTYI